MIRIPLLVIFVALLLASPAGMARESGMDPAGDEACLEKHDSDQAAPASARVTGSKVPARETRARAGSRGGVPSGRPNSPRWHSFLPGMFR